MRVGRFLAAGSFGKVYEGEFRVDSSLPWTAPVAFKIFTGRMSPSRRAAIISELRALARVQHENVVQLLGIIEMTDGGLAAVLEFCSGGDLNRRITNLARPLSWAERLAVAAQMASALAYMHSIGMVHGDFKPANVLLDGAGNAKLADFGLAVWKDGSAVGPTMPTSMPGPGSAPGMTCSAIGTLDYMAPELLPTAGAADAVRRNPASDVYALGIVLWQLMSRRKPYLDADSICRIAAGGFGDTPMGCANRRAMLLEGHRPSMKADTIDAHTPPAFKALVQACWATNPRARPSADAVVAALIGMGAAPAVAVGGAGLAPAALAPAVPRAAVAAPVAVPAAAPAPAAALVARTAPVAPAAAPAPQVASNFSVALQAAVAAGAAAAARPRPAPPAPAPAPQAASSFPVDLQAVVAAGAAAAAAARPSSPASSTSSTMSTSSSVSTTSSAASSASSSPAASVAAPCSVAAAAVSGSTPATTAARCMAAVPAPALVAAPTAPAQTGVMPSIAREPAAAARTSSSAAPAPAPVPAPAPARASAPAPRPVQAAAAPAPVRRVEAAAPAPVPAPARRVEVVTYVRMQLLILPDGRAVGVPVQRAAGPAPAHQRPASGGVESYTCGLDRLASAAMSGVSGGPGARLPAQYGYAVWPARC